jgi:hypothetical protein
VSPSHYVWADHVELVEEWKERLAYMSAEELLSAREVYIRVAVIDIVTSVGIRNIYILVGCRKASELQLLAERNVRY